MKAVKLSKIQWNLSDLSPEEREEVKKTLPTVKGFKAPDDFKVAEKVPVILKKKYGIHFVITEHCSEFNKPIDQINLLSEGSFLVVRFFRHFFEKSDVFL